MKNQKKFQIEKFQIAKLTNPKVIIGGTGGNDPTTNTQQPKPDPDNPNPGPIIVQGPQGPGGNPQPNSTVFCNPN